MLATPNFRQPSVTQRLVTLEPTASTVDAVISAIVRPGGSQGTTCKLRRSQRLLLRMQLMEQGNVSQSALPPAVHTLLQSLTAHHHLLRSLTAVAARLSAGVEGQYCAGG